MAPADPADAVGTVRSWIAASQAVTVLTGAGISTDSGIPDFRGPHGLWTKNPAAEKTATLSAYLADPEVRKRAWAGRRANPAWRAEPNRGHHAVAELQRRGHVAAVITQNVDGLHQKAGSTSVIEVHGNITTAVCWGCEASWPMDHLIARVEAGEEDPACDRCGGVVKSAAILFGQPLVPDIIDAALGLARSSEVFLAVGTTLGVYPVARCVPLAQAAGARVVIVNGSETEMDDRADVVLRGSISELLSALL